MEEDKVTTPDKSKDDQTPTKGRKGRDDNKLRSGADSKREGRKSSAGRRTARRGSAISPPPGVAVTPVSEGDGR